MKMPNMFPFEKRHFLTWIDLNPGFGRNCDTFLKKFNNGTFQRLQKKVFGPKKFQIPCRESKVPNWQFLLLHFWFSAWNLKNFVSKYLHLKCFEWAISGLFQKCVLFSLKSKIYVNSGQKVPFLKRTHIWHFHSCFLVFSYHISII
jgi:hypothetical protein